MKISRRLVVILILPVVTAGCGLFETRSPENPAGAQNTDELALSPEEALAQLETALMLHDPSLYMAAISQNFSYGTTPSAFPEDPAYFDEWTWAREDVFIRTLLAPALLPPDSSSTLSFEAIDEVSLADSAVFRDSYHLEIAPTSSDLPRIYDGLADLTFKREQDGGWRVVRWVDDASGGRPTMSQLRAAL